MSHLKRRLLLIIIIGSLFFGLLAGITWLSTTHKALEWAFTAAQNALPGKLTVEKISGQITSNIDLKNLHYHDTGFDVHIQHLNLKWHPTALLNDTLHIQSIQLENAKIIDSRKSTTHQSIQEYFFGSSQRSRKTTRHSRENGHLKIIKSFPKSIVFKFNNIKIHHLSFIDNRDPKTPPTKRFSNIDTLQAQITINTRAQSTVSISKASGHIKGQPFFGHVKLIITPKHIHALDMNIQLADTHLQAKGQLEKKWNIQWNVDSPHLSVLFPHTKGALSSKGHITGTRKKPQLNAQLEINQLSNHSYALQRFKGSIALNFAKIFEGQLALSIDGLRVGEYHINPIHIQGHTTHQKGHIKAQITLDPTSLLYSGATRPYELKLKGGSFNLQTTRKGLEGHTTLSLLSPNDLNAEIRLPNYTLKSLPTPQQKVQASLTWHPLYQHNLLASLLPYIETSRSQINAKAKLTGTLSNPQFKGHFQLNRAEAFIPKLNITLKQLNLQATANRRAVNYRASCQLGQQPLRLSGQTALIPPYFPSKFTLHGQNLLISNTSQVILYVTPQLSLEAQIDHATLKGSVIVPKAIIRSPDFSLVETLPDELVYTYPPTQSQTTPLCIGYPRSPDTRQRHSC